MIRIKFREWLAIRNLTASKVFLDTNIARSTLSNLSNNSSGMIKLETIDKLCTYLDISPGEFFDFYPVDFSCDYEMTFLDEVDFYEMTCTVKLQEKYNSYYLHLKGKFDFRFTYEVDGHNEENNDSTALAGSLFLDPVQKENQQAINQLKQYPVGIIEEIKERIRFELSGSLVAEKGLTWSKGGVILDYKK